MTPRVVFDPDPPTHPVPVYLLRVGTTILESAGHLATVTRVHGVNRVKVWCRYVWQRESEPQWLFGSLDRENLVEVVDQRRQKTN